jgi:hypothetical protein
MMLPASATSLAPSPVRSVWHLKPSLATKPTPGDKSFLLLFLKKEVAFFPG